MTRCKNIRKFLFEYNRSELDPERQGVVQKHLESCPGCSAYFTATSTFLNSLKGTVPVSGLSPKGIANGIGGTFLSSADDFWANYDIKLFERLEKTRRRTIFQLYLPKLRPVISEVLAGFVVLFVLLAMIEKGLGYDLKTYLYLLKQVW